MIFDTHAHYDAEAFDQDRDAILDALQTAGIQAVVNVGASLESTEKTLALVKSYPFIYGSVGVHPSECQAMTEPDMDWLESLTGHEKIVAVGEIGLDYYWEEPEHAVQQKWFIRQLALAKKSRLPVIIHSRDAAKDTLDIIKRENGGENGGVIHCFSYGKEMAQEYLEMGFYLGIGGVLTFKNVKRLKEVVAYAPIERLVLETDCPYLAPEPNRGKRNSSLNLPYVVKAIAAIKGVTEKEVEQITWANAKKLYRL